MPRIKQHRSCIGINLVCTCGLRHPLGGFLPSLLIRLLGRYRYLLSVISERYYS